MSPKTIPVRIPPPGARLHDLAEVLPKVELVETAPPEPLTPEELAEILPNVELIESDGIPLDSDWHRLAMDLLVESVAWQFRARTDFYVGGNMFIYYCEEQAGRLSYRGPDFFFVDGVPCEPIRRYWAVWREGGRYPDVIMELMSPTTAKHDLGEKKDIYEKVFRTGEYYCYDPATLRLRGWRLVDEQYVEIQPDAQGRLESKQLGLWVGVWHGVFQTRENDWLRLFDADGRLVLIQSEHERQRADAEKQNAEAEKQRAEAEKQRANAEKQNAEAEKQNAEAEKQRADAAEAELARLRAALAARAKPDKTS